MTDKINPLVANIPFSTIREMSIRAEQYEDVIPLGIGEPDFDTPEIVSRMAFEDTLKGATHYAPAKGDPELIDQVSKYIKQRSGQDMNAANILITGGGMGALAAFFQTILNEGDEVLVPTPFFPPYKPQIEWVGGKFIPVPTTIENNYVPTLDVLEKKVTQRTKAILINNPGNPTGTVYSDDDLTRISKFAVDHDLLVVNDEVYERVTFSNKKFKTIAIVPGMEERTVTIHSFSKSYAMTGWRIGYAFGPEKIIEAMTKVISYNTSCASSVSQRAAVAALRVDQKPFIEMANRFKKRRDLVHEELSKIKGIKLNKPEGAFYIFVDLGEITDDGRAFALGLLADQKVALIPGEAFGQAYKHCVRIAYTVKRDLLKEAVKRIATYIETLRK